MSRSPWASSAAEKNVRPIVDAKHEVSRALAKRREEKEFAKAEVADPQLGLPALRVSKRADLPSMANRIAAATS